MLVIVDENFGSAIRGDNNRHSCGAAEPPEFTDGFYFGVAAAFVFHKEFPHFRNVGFDSARAKVVPVNFTGGGICRANQKREQEKRRGAMFGQWQINTGKIPASG